MAVIEQRYAAALADLVARGDIAAADLARDLRQVSAMLAESAGLATVLVSPAVNWPHKRAVIEALAARAQLAPITRNFLLVVAQRGRAARIPGIARALDQLLLERRGIVRAEVASARALSAAERLALEQALARRLGRQLETHYRLQPDLVGGFVARVGDDVYDASILGRLQRLRHQLTA
jgi:F-type H+-transporting ATPase subunit delta